MTLRIGGSSVSRADYQSSTLNELRINGNTVWQNRIEATLTGTVQGLNVRAWLLNNTAWNGTSPVNAVINIGTSSSAATITGTNTSGSHGITCNLSAFPAGSHIELIWRNTVNVRAAGGDGGGQVLGAFSQGGRPGGDAIRITGTGSTLVLNFNGFSGLVVRGAGGGGYISATYSTGGQPRYYIVAGGGGAGTPAGRGGRAEGGDINLPGNDATEYLSGLGIQSTIGRSGSGGNSQPSGNSVGAGQEGIITVSATNPYISSAGATGWALRGHNRATITGEQNVNFVGTRGNS